MPGLIAILSPAKTLDMDPKNSDIKLTKGRFQSKSNDLAKTMQGYSSSKIASLMKLSDKLSSLNADRWKQFGGRGNPSGPAAMCFRGHVYQGLEAWTMDKRSLNWAQKHIRILSGLYGLLRPLDKIEPYRLEMGTPLKTSQGKNLYEFWGDSIMKMLKKDLQDAKAKVLLNLASQEYSKVIDMDALGVTVLDTAFLEKSGSKTRFISFDAKVARGLMARWVSMAKPKTIEDLKGFNLDGYGFDRSSSEESNFVFTRKRPASRKAG